MKIKIIFLTFLFLLIPKGVLAESKPALNMAGIFKSAYSYSVSTYKEIKKEKMGTFLPGVFDNNTPRFTALSQSAKEAIIKNNEQERLKRLAQQQSLGIVEAAMDGKYLDVDLSTQTLTAFQDRQAIYRFKVSTGMRSMPTPTGTFKILNKYSRAYSRKYALYMPYWMGFTGQGHGFHELPETASGRKEGASSLGRPVSHGCIRLGVGPAKTIYDWSEVGDTIYIHR